MYKNTYYIHIDKTRGMKWGKIWDRVESVSERERNGEFYNLFHHYTYNGDGGSTDVYIVHYKPPGSRWRPDVSAATSPQRRTPQK